MSYPITIPFSPVDPVTGIASPPNGALLHTPRVDLGVKFASAVYTFFVTGTSTAANVYQNGALTTAFSPTGQVTADAYGRFPAIYLDPAITYKVVLTYSGGSRTCDPYQPALATTGSSTVAGVGLSVNSSNEYKLSAPSSGGSGNTLTLAAPSNGAALALVGDVPGTPLLIVNSSATTGSQTATFTATNKPGTSTSGPAGWLPIQCDGTVYYAPLWFDNNFQRYAFLGTAFNGSAISALTAEFNSNGSYTLTGTGATAVPATWASPLQSGLGSSYWLKLLQSSGNATLTQSSGTLGSWTNIGSGLTLGSSTTYASATGSFQLSSASGGSPVVASGTISVPATGTINGSTISVTTVEFNSDGSYTLTGAGASASPSQWATPTLTSIGSSYWLNLTQTGGAATLTQSSGSLGSWTNIGSGLTIGSNSIYASATGSFQLSSASGGSPVVASGTISVPATGTINGSTISAASIAFNSDGSYTITSGTASPSQWATPTQTGVGSNYWLNLSKTGGLAGANFAQSSGSVGSWTNIGSGLTLTSPSGTSTVSGTFQLSSASGGSPVVASGTISLTGTTGATNPTINVGALQFATNGTIANQGGSAPGNWYLPTTTSIGSSYYLYMTTTGGTNGVTIGGISQSTYTALTSGLNIYPTAVSATGATGYASGTYSLSTSASGSGVVATGTWTIGNQTSCPQAQSQTAAALTGTAQTFNTNGTMSGGGNWYLPTTTSIGSSYYVMINNFTSAATGGSFSLSGGMTSGTWYALSSAQSFTVGSSGSPLGGWHVTYQISSAAGGSPILAQGSINQSNAG